MSLWESVIVLVLAMWLTANVFYSLMNKKIARYTYRADLFKWLSAFQLFSERAQSFQLSYRDMLADQSVTQWELVQLGQQWRSYHAVWFPGRTLGDCVKSIMGDLVHFIRKDQSGFGKKKIKERFIYHALIHFLDRYPRNNTDLGRQFRIQDKENNEIFISDFYKE